MKSLTGVFRTAQKFLGALLLSLIVFGSTGCGDGNKPAEPPSNPAPLPANPPTASGVSSGVETDKDRQTNKMP